MLPYLLPLPPPLIPLPFKIFSLQLYKKKACGMLQTNECTYVTLLAVKLTKGNAPHNEIQHSDLLTDNYFCTNFESMYVLLHTSDPDTN
jgi:hypothetical protein